MKENNENEKEINKEEKQVDSLKDDIKKENISDINIKNQSIHNENEEIKILIDDNQRKNSKNKREDIIKKVNKIPDVEPNYEVQFNDTMRKIKNKSLEKIMKDIFDSDKKKSSGKKSNNNENKFIDKLKEIEDKIEEIDEYKRKKKTEFKMNLKKNNEEKNNRYENFDKNKENNINSDKDFFDFNFSTKLSYKNKESKYKNLKKWYFSSEQFKFYNSPLDINNKKNQILNYYEEMKKTFRKYNGQRLRRLNNKIRITNIPDNFKNILDKVDKLKQSQKENKILNNKLFNNNKLSLSGVIRNKNNNNNLRTLSMEKPSKLKNIIEDIYSEINKVNNISSRKNFSNKLSSIKSKMKYPYSGRNNLEIIKANNIMGRNRFTKSCCSNLDDLLKLCSKRNLKKIFI